MSNIISKIKLRIALKENNKFDLSCDHVTTTDFFKIAPTYIKEMVPGEKLKVNVSTFTRLSPLVNPMYGRCRIINRGFFVPMRTIMRGWNEFITDVPYNSKFLSVPTINPKTLATCIKSDSTLVSATDAYDFTVTSGSSTTYWKMTSFGKLVWTVLCSLGYKFSPGYWLGVNDADITTADKFSALPLLAFTKIYKDWYQNLAYTTWTFDDLFDWSVSNTSTDLDFQTLDNALSFCVRAVYDKDYFTSAWDRPVSPNNGLNSANNILDVTNDGLGASRGRSAVSNLTAPSLALPSTPVLGGTTGGATVANPYAITQYAVDALKALTDYLKRHQIAGGLALDRMMSRFGMKPSDAALDRSVYLGKQDIEIQIADVMATAAGSDGDNTSTVGDYAGKGIGFDGRGNFEYDTKEFGYFVIVSTLVPKIGYVLGLNRRVLHLDRLDFFTPEFDSLGVLGIARKELLNDYNGAEPTLGSLTTDAALNGVFGYTSRYAEYKTSSDALSGDFSVNSTNGAGSNDKWHLFRMFDPQSVVLNDITHNESFTLGESAQYDRVFSMTSSDYDHFINIHHFEVECYAPMSKLFDDYDFDGGKKEVNIEVNGTQLN